MGEKDAVSNHLEMPAVYSGAPLSAGDTFQEPQMDG